MELKLFENYFDLDDSDFHEKYKLLKNEPLLIIEKNILSQWTDGFVDRDNKIIKEFQTSFHSSFWEFYLFNYFKKLGFEIDFTKDRPDFIITNSQKIIIEAVVSEIKITGDR